MSNLQEVILDLKANGFSRSEIEKQLGCSSHTISKYINNSCGDYDETIKLKIQNLRKQNKSIKEIHKITGYSKSTVSKWCSKIDCNDDIKQLLIKNKKLEYELCKIEKRKNISVNKTNNRAIRNNTEMVTPNPPA